jgi:uncharacterized membrane protein YfcA
LPFWGSRTPPGAAGLGSRVLSGLTLVIALAVVCLGAVVMGTVSFGMGLAVTPVLLLFLEAQEAVVIANTLIGLLLCLVVFQTRRHLDLRRVGGMTLGGLAAVPLGALALAWADAAVLRVTIALVILALCLLAVLNVRLPLARRRFAGPAFGFMASLSVTTLSIGGPLAAFYVMAQGWPTPVMRASLAFYFLVADAAAFGFYLWAGLVTRDALTNIGLLLPALALGLGASSLLVRRMDEAVFRYAAIAVSAAGSLVLLARELAGR